MGFVQRWFTPSDSDGSGMAPSTPAPLPAAPVQEDADAKAGEMMTARRKRMSKTILTGPQGLDTNFETSKKTLLGA